MKWLKRKLQSWLGIEQLSKRTTDIWWDINDSSGLKQLSRNHENVLDALIEMLAHPEAFQWNDKGFIWQSPNWEDSKLAWMSAPNKQPNQTYYNMLEHWTRHDIRDKDYTKPAPRERLDE